MSASVKKQRGAALMVVLLLAATLSFIMLALVSAMNLSVRRTGGAALRSELIWLSTSADTFAAMTIREALQAARAGGPPLSSQHPLFSQQIAIPFDRGVGAVIFADATRCFNVNSLSSDATSGGNNENGPSKELVEILKAVGLSDGDAANIAAVIKDWVDEDDIQEIGGAEDNFYSSLPTPYRTAGAPIASITELRAMQGVTPELYAAISPFLCALPTRNPAIINVNVLRPEDAPLLTGMTGGVLDPARASDLIARRPPGGWAQVSQFWAQPAFQDDDIDAATLTPRTAVSSNYIEALAGATVNEIDMNVRLLFSADEGGRVSLVSRELDNGR